MGLIKEYVDREVQTDAVTFPSPYADPAVVLAAPPVTRSLPTQHIRTGHHNLTSASPPTEEYDAPQSPVSPMLAPLVSRRLYRRKHARGSAAEIANRRIVSMPENKSETLFLGHGKRVVSMPDRVRPALEPSVELYQSPASTGSCSGRYERIRVFRAPSDVPQTPSPPSSPESLLIIAAGTQLPEGFLRRKYSPEPLVEEDGDWVTWANSPPRPIPALHGPLSLPYARCPSGAEGTIIEEPDNVAQMIWGLGPDDQPQVHTESLSAHLDNPQNAPSHGSGQIPPRSQKKRTSGASQAPKLPRTHVPSHVTHAKHSLGRSQRQAHDDTHSVLSQVSADVEARQDTVSGPPWNEGKSMATNVGVLDNLVNGTDVFPPAMDGNRVLEWQLARLRHALRASLADMDPYTTLPGRLEPVVPPATPGLPQSYPRIFVEPRPNDSITAATRQTSIEIAQQYRQQQLYRQALQKQKLQIQNFLPTPPNSSSPQWSPHFSPYLTYCSTVSPELVGAVEHPIPVSSQKIVSGTNTTQYLRHAHDQHETDDVNTFDLGTDTSWSKIPQIVSDAPLRQSASSASTLAKYIKQLQALSPVAHFSSLQSVTPATSLLSLPSADENVGPFRTAYHSPAVPTPPSPESPPTIPRGYNSSRSMTRPVQRRLSSVLEEDSAILELSTSVSPSRLQSQLTTEGISSSHDVLQPRFVDVSRKPVVLDVPEVEGGSGSSSMLHHETSPVKVRLPVTKEHNLREQTGGYHEQNQHGSKKKHRYKKPKGSAAANEPTTVRGLVG